MSMKKLILALVLAGLVTPAFAATVFFWRAEGTALDATHDFSAGDTSATASGSVSISNTAARTGTNGILRATTTASSYDFDATSIWPSAATPANSVFSFAYSFQHQTSVAGNSLVMGLRARDGSNNDSIQVNTAASGQGAGANLILRIGNGTTATTMTTDSAGMTAGNWYAVVVRVDIPNDDRKIEIYDAAGALLDSAEDLATDLGTHAPTDINLLQLGTGSATMTHDTWFDTFIISDVYAAPLENFLTAASFQPAYSVALTNGTFTNTTLPFTYTPDQNGTTYMAACTNGQTVTTFANLKTGTCSGGAAVGTGTDTSTGGVADTVTITGLVAGTTYDVYGGHESSLGGQTALTSLADRTTTSASINFAVGPSEAPATNGYTISGTITCTGTCTVEAVACAPGDAAPTANEIEAGQCGGGNAALINASEVWTTNVANDFLLTSANKPPRLDVYVSGTDGTTDTSVNTFADQDRSLRAGFALICLTSVAATSIFDLDSYFDPDFAANYCAEYEDDTNESADCNVSFEADGDFVLTPVVAGDCDGLRTFEISYEYNASATTALFTAPTVGNFTTDDTVYINNTAPVCNPAPADESVLLDEDVAMLSRDFRLVCSDADGHTLTFAVTVGTLPLGTSMDSAGLWSGTPTTENEIGVAITVQACDPAGDCDTFDFTVYVVNTWTVPNCVTNTASECVDEIVTAAPWREQEVGFGVNSLTCDSGTPGLILTQDPAAAAEAAPFTAIGVTLSQLCSDSGDRCQRFGFGFCNP